MTRNGGFKRHVRERVRRTGESYSTARAHLRRRSVRADTELVSRSAAPIVVLMHVPDPAVRQAVVPGLTRDQGSLLAFWILFVHWDDGVSGLCRAHPHRVVDPNFWTLIETGLREYPALLGITARLRKEVERAGEGTHYSWLERLDADVMRELDAEFKALMPDSLHQMADYIRAHPDRFDAAKVPAR